MRVTHEICIAAPADAKACQALMDALLVALGHGPDIKFKAEHAEDTVSGRATVEWCEARALGADVLEFRDGHRETACAENIGAWFEEQGHRLMKIDGSTAYGNTIVHVQYTERDESPAPGRRTTLQRAIAMPTEAEVRERIDAFAASI